MPELPFPRPAVARQARLTPEDRALVARCRHDHTRIGFAYQLGFVRLIGRLPRQQPLEVIGELLRFVALQLRLEDQAEEDGLGFVEDVGGSPGEKGGRTLFVKTEFGGCWHFWNPDAGEAHLRAEPVEANRLRCIITGLRVYLKPGASSKYSDSLKLRVEVAGGPVGELEAGFDSAFARSLLAAVATAGHREKGVFDRPVTIEAVPGREPNVVLANLFVDGERVFPASYANVSSERLLVGALRALGVPEHEILNRVEAVFAERGRLQGPDEGRR